MANFFKKKSPRRAVKSVEFRQFTIFFPFSAFDHLNVQTICLHSPMAKNWTQINEQPWPCGYGRRLMFQRS